MPEAVDPRVAVYIDFDNIVISRYDQVHGRSQFMRDKPRGFSPADRKADPEIAEKLNRATVDVGAIIDFASSFGTIVLTRAYADWSAPVNADYRGQLVSRAVDLVQLFPAAAYAKNGADIRLAVDTVEDMFRLPDLTHVIIVAGDSDYIPLAQRCKRLGRYVVAIGVAGSTSRSLAAACDEFATYDALPGVKPIAPAPEATPAPEAATAATRPSRSKKTAADTTSAEPAKDVASPAAPVFSDPESALAPPRRRASRRAKS
ncbi:MAG: NYN domain-containing protein, partial [Mycetocola sp.]